jgi:hypothetical protein
MPAAIHACTATPCGGERSPAARLATSGETFELAKLSTPSAQAVVQRRMSLGDRLLPKPDEPKTAAKRLGSRRISGTSWWNARRPGLCRKRTGSRTIEVPQAEGSADIDK